MIHFSIRQKDKNNYVEYAVKDVILRYSMQQQCDMLRNSKWPNISASLLSTKNPNEREGWLLKLGRMGSHQFGLSSPIAENNQQIAKSCIWMNLPEKVWLGWMSFCVMQCTSLLSWTLSRKVIWARSCFCRLYDMRSTWTPIVGVAAFR